MAAIPPMVRPACVIALLDSPLTPLLALSRLDRILRFGGTPEVTGARARLSTACRKFDDTDSVIAGGSVAFAPPRERASSARLLPLEPLNLKCLGSGSVIGYRLSAKREEDSSTWVDHHFISRSDGCEIASSISRRPSLVGH